jgi:hypothetical protein
VLCEIKVLGDNPGSLGWLPPVLVLGGIGASVALAWLDARRLRAAVLAGALGLLLLAPATWAVETLGHPTNGTFPAGGPVATGFGGPGGGGGGRFGGPPGGGRFGGPPGGAGGGFGRGTQDLGSAVAYAQAHGGGMLAVSSQEGAAPSIIASGADVAGIGGFSGRESEVTVSWLADAVRAGKVRWVLAAGAGAGRFGGGPSTDGRTGATTALSAVQSHCVAVPAVSRLYDCAGQAAALSGASQGS